MTEQQHTEISSLQFIKWTDLYNTEKPYQIFIDLPPSTPRTNVDFEVKDVPFRDIRGKETSFELDTHGFMMRHTEEVKGLDEDPTAEFMEKVYLPSVENLVKKEVKGADRVKIFDWRVCASVVLACLRELFVALIRIHDVLLVKEAETDKMLESRMYLIDMLATLFPSNYLQNSSQTDAKLFQLRSARNRTDGETINLKNLSDRLAPANNAHLDQEPASALGLVNRTLPSEADELLKGRFRIIK